MLLVLLGLLCLGVFAFNRWMAQTEEEAMSSVSVSPFRTPTARLNVRVEGRRLPHTPMVVLEAGIGHSSLMFRFLSKLLSKHTCVVSYDRAGVGLSESGRIPATAEASSENLCAVLTQLGAVARRSVILVGHREGCTNVLTFAAMYPSTVAGLVLLDPPPTPIPSCVHDAITRPSASQTFQPITTQDVQSDAAAAAAAVADKTPAAATTTATPTATSPSTTKPGAGATESAVKALAMVPRRALLARVVLSSVATEVVHWLSPRPLLALLGVVKPAGFDQAAALLSVTTARGLCESHHMKKYRHDVATQQCQLRHRRTAALEARATDWNHATLSFRLQRHPTLFRHFPITVVSPGQQFVQKEWVVAASPTLSPMIAPSKPPAGVLSSTSTSSSSSPSTSTSTSDAIPELELPSPATPVPRSPSSSPASTGRSVDRSHHTPAVHRRHRHRRRGSAGFGRALLRGLGEYWCPAPNPLTDVCPTVLKAHKTLATDLSRHGRHMVLKDACSMSMVMDHRHAEEVALAVRSVLAVVSSQ